MEEQTCVCPDCFLCIRQQILLPSQCVLRECLFDVNLQKMHQTNVQQITAFCF